MDDKDFLNYCGINKNDLINIENNKFKKANEVYKYKNGDWVLYKNIFYKNGCKEIKTNGRWKYVQMYGIMNYTEYWNCRKYIYFNNVYNYKSKNVSKYSWIKEHEINGFYYNKNICKNAQKISTYYVTPNYLIYLINNNNYILKYLKSDKLFSKINNILKINNYCLFIFG